MNLYRTLFKAVSIPINHLVLPSADRKVFTENPKKRKTFWIIMIINNNSIIYPR